MSCNVQHTSRSEQNIENTVSNWIVFERGWSAEAFVIAEHTHFHTFYNPTLARNSSASVPDSPIAVLLHFTHILQK